MLVEALLTHAPTYSSQWMAALVAVLPQIIIDLPIYTLIIICALIYACWQGAVEGKVRIRTANYYFFRLRNRQKLVRIRYG